MALLAAAVARGIRARGLPRGPFERIDQGAEGRVVQVDLRHRRDAVDGDRAVLEGRLPGDLGTEPWRLPEAAGLLDVLELDRHDVERARRHEAVDAHVLAVHAEARAGVLDLAGRDVEERLAVGARHDRALLLRRLPGRQGDEDEIGGLAVDLHVRAASTLAREMALGDAGGTPLAPDQAGERGGDEELSGRAHGHQLQEITRTGAA